MLLWFDERELRFRPESECALTPAYKLGKIGCASAFIANIPKCIAGRVFRYLWFVCLDELGVFSEECIHLAINISLKGVELLLVFDFFGGQ